MHQKLLLIIFGETRVRVWGDLKMDEEILKLFSRTHVMILMHEAFAGMALRRLSNLQTKVSMEVT